MKRSITLALAIIMICLNVSARQPQRGYRGFVEWSSSVRSDNFGYWTSGNNIAVYRETTFYTGFSTSHGYQINSMFYIGAGLGMERCGKFDNWIVPLFIDGRIDLKFNRLTPFGDIRIGANMAQGGGLYFSPAIGYRFNWGRKTGLNIGAGLTLAGYKTEHYEGTWVDSDSYEIQYVATRHHVHPYFTFRLGIDF
ncbi:MAG: hypothetical protein Q4C34_02630 [Bacteroidales bacterium]|nr:hypothetical protein [Bacteroidales bacterium]